MRLYRRGFFHSLKEWEFKIFTVFHLIRNRSIPKRTLNKLYRHMEEFESTAQGAWMREFNWRGMEFRYCDWMPHMEVGGAHSVVCGNTIFLADLHPGQPESYREGYEIYQFYPVTVHELRHKYQRKKLKTGIYSFLHIPIIRELTLEKDAYEMEDVAYTFFGKIDCIRSHWAFLERQEKMAEKRKKESE